MLLAVAGFSAADAATWYVDGSVPESGDGKSWATAFGKIQEGVDAACDGDTVTVAEGLYWGVGFNGKNVCLVSVEPADAAVVARTLMDVDGHGAAVRFDGTEDETCVLSGFTIRGGAGAANYAGGALQGRGTRATIRNNVIANNSHWMCGAGIAECDGLIENNIIADNVAGNGLSVVGFGGGLYWCNGVIRNNLITGNRAAGAVLWFGPDDWRWVDGEGGGLHSCNGTIENNTISDNYAYAGGAGLAYCDGTIVGNRVTGNILGGLADCGGTIINNVVSRNEWLGLRSCNGLILCNTVVANWTSAGVAGLESCRGTIAHCIIWGNASPEGIQAVDSTDPTYSCVQDWTGGGEGNITGDPRFVDAQNGDFRLLPDSPCIDAGFNSPDLPQFDIAGMHRIMFGGKSLTVDMGAYEFYINTLTRGPTPDQTTFTWSSLADKTYSVFYSDDLLTWHIAIGNFPSLGNQTTSWLDDGSLTGLPPLLAPKRFYRLLENP